MAAAVAAIVHDGADLKAARTAMDAERGQGSSAGALSSRPDATSRGTVAELASPPVVYGLAGLLKAVRCSRLGAARS